MHREKRRYPRVGCDHDGHLEIRYRDGTEYHRLLIAVEIRSVAPEGAGLVLTDIAPAVPLARGTPVTLRFHPEDRELEIPGRIAWGSQSNQQPVHVGVKFQLELAPIDTRQAYARWIIGEMAAARRS